MEGKMNFKEAWMAMRGGLRIRETSWEDEYEHWYLSPGELLYDEKGREVPAADAVFYFISHKTDWEFEIAKKRRVFSSEDNEAITVATGTACCKECQGDDEHLEFEVVSESGQPLELRVVNPSQYGHPGSNDSAKYVSTKMDLSAVKELIKALDSWVNDYENPGR